MLTILVNKLQISKMFTNIPNWSLKLFFLALQKIIIPPERRTRADQGGEEDG